MNPSWDGNKGSNEEPKGSYNSKCDAKVKLDPSAGWYSLVPPDRDKCYDGNNLCSGVSGGHGSGNICTQGYSERQLLGPHGSSLLEEGL